MDTPDSLDPPPDDASGTLGKTLLGRYRVDKILGWGGMGEVLLAHDTLLHRPVALKRLRSADETGGSRRSAILREARRASRIGDRRIAAIYDVLELDDDVLIVMEYVEGSTLRARMKQPVSLEAFWNLSTQCIEAVGAAHAFGIIHRDIKPENLMVTGNDEIKILDFGVSKRAEGEGRALTITSTATDLDARTIAGTPHYMAPESHYGGKVDERTDIFSLGVVFYELLAGRHPFGGPEATYEVVLGRIMNTDPPPLVEVNSSVGPGLSTVITRMLAKDPTQRHASCAELKEDMQRAREADKSSSVAVAMTPPKMGGRSKSVRITSLLALLVAVAASALWWAWQRPTLPRHRILAVLAPVTPGAKEDDASFALGTIDLLSARLQSHQTEPGFQTASFREGLDEKVGSPEDAKRVLGANLALISRLEQRANGFHARLELWDATRKRMVGARTVAAPLSKPFEFLDRIYLNAAALSGLKPRPGIKSREGVRGAGTLRFLLQGIGRLWRVETEAEARRALDDFELACRTEPEAASARAWLALGQHKMYVVTHDDAWLAKEEASAREAVGLDSNCAVAHRALATALATKRDFQGSLDELARTCALDPTDDDSYSRFARTYSRLGKPELEKETYRKVIAARPHCWQPYWWLAASYFRDGDVEGAIGAFEQMIRRAPDLHKGYSSLGGLLVLHGDYTRAIDTLKLSVALKPTKVAFDNLGTAYFNSGRLAESVDAYNQSFQFGFADYGSWLNLADAYYWLRNREDQAAEAYAQCVRLARELSSKNEREGHTFDVMIPANLATVFPKLGQPDSARASLGIALKADSTNSMVQYCAALTYWQLEEKSRGMAWLERAVRGGYPVVWLRDSPIFQPWRSEPGFQALIASAEPPSRSASNENGGRK